MSEGATSFMPKKIQVTQPHASTQPPAHPTDHTPPSPEELFWPRPKVIPAITVLPDPHKHGASTRLRLSSDCLPIDATITPPLSSSSPSSQPPRAPHHQQAAPPRILTTTIALSTIHHRGHPRSQHIGTTKKGAMVLSTPRGCFGINKHEKGADSDSHTEKRGGLLLLWQSSTHDGASGFGG
ncbi:hypothetical protein Tco_0638970 [Tanacetum coccineum]